MTNPLFSDRDVDFLLHEVHDVTSLTKIPAFADHSKETFDMFLDSVRRFSREALFPSYRAMDVEPPVYVDGRMKTHPSLRALYGQMAELGILSAHRSPDAGGQMLPGTVHTVATAYLMAANCGAYGYIGLTSGAAHLIEVFGSDELKRRFMEPMLDGRFTGTMALTEPQAGSSLSDVQTRAIPQSDGSFHIVGNKIFISGADNAFSQNVVHLTLARIDGAPAGTKGISLFAIPRLREGDGGWVDNDVTVAGAIHKLGARAIPSCVLNFGERGDCKGWLVGEAHRGLPHMFQMMNEARIMVGVGGIATASAAYQASLAYAKDRTQGRVPSEKDPKKPPVPIIQHADVRRMLLHQKAIVEGGLSLIIAVSKLHDTAQHSDDAGARARAGMLVDLLTPIVKSFPAEHGFLSNALAIQVHGGHGYSQDHLVEAWLRDQKLNSLHEGTTGIQSLDLLGRKVIADGGAALRVLENEIRASVVLTQSMHPEDKLCAGMCEVMADVLGDVAMATNALMAMNEAGHVDKALSHSANYLELLSIVVVFWQWLEQMNVARSALKAGAADTAFYEGKLCAGEHWCLSEVVKVPVLAGVCIEDNDSHLRMRPEWF